MRVKAALAFPALGVACGALWLAARGTGIPSPELPVPNAYDDYVQAGRALRGSDGRTLIRDTELYEAQDRAPTADVLNRGEPALRRLRQGFAHRYVQPPLRSYLDREADPTRHYSSFRALTRLLVAEGQLKQARGDRAGAARSYLDGVRLGVDIAHGASLIGAFTGLACESIPRRPLWKALGRLDAATSARAASELEALEERRVPLHTTLLEKKWSMRAVLGESDPEIEGGLLARLRGGVARSRTLSDYTPIIDAHIANARLPYAAPKAAVPAPRDAQSAQATMILVNPAFHFARHQAQSALLRAALAAHAYRGHSGQAPRSLGDLVPKYLRSVPADPFALDKPMRYKVASGGRPVLYSIGPDGRDDGGRAIATPERYRPGKLNHRVLATSRGDIVAGVNT